MFSDDVGCAVRDQYRDLLREGQEGEAATEALLAMFAEVLLDEDSSAVFWLALAVTQWRVGRLEERVKMRAMEAMANDLALRAWEETPAMLAGRRKELAKVAALLESPQRAKAKLRKRSLSTCDWERGELIAFQLRSGQYVIFRVIGLWTQAGETCPVVEILEWCGPAIPDLAVLREVPIHRLWNDEPEELQLWISPWTKQFLLIETGRYRIPAERIERLRWHLPPTQTVGACGSWLWRNIDDELERWFGYR